MTIILQEVPLDELGTTQCDGILMAYSPYDESSLDVLSSTLADFSDRGVTLPPVMLCRTRSDLSEALRIQSELPTRFIKKYCSFSSAELLFYGDKTPEAFYSQMAQFFMKAHGLYASSRLQRSMQDISHKIVQQCYRKVPTYMFNFWLTAVHLVDIRLGIDFVGHTARDLCPAQAVESARARFTSSPDSTCTTFCW